MVATNPFKEHPYSLTKKWLPWTLYALLPIAIIRLYFYPLPLSVSQPDQLPVNTPIVITASSSSLSRAHPPPSKEEEKINVRIECDYAKGKWVHDEWGPLYNDTSCGTIKDGQNCMSHGRPDKGYLYWRWRPNQCHLPRFEPKTFLHLLRNKHLAFVGDSLARNQLESLICLLATASTPNLIYRSGEDKFRRWHFSSHNVNISIYWSPFLVKGIEKSNNGPNYNKLYLDSVDEKWADDMDHIDMIILSIGHWFLHPAVYFYGDTVLGCHICPGENYTEVGYFDVFGKAFETTLKAILDKRGGHGNPIDVIVTTFSPSHFEGQWDKFGACPKLEPYKEGKKQLDWGDAEMRRKELKEVEEAKVNTKKFANLRMEALDVTELSLMRPDSHPGPYMHPNPFANGIKEQVQNDCVHWCLPGAIDTWNEILLEIMKGWEGQSRRER